jgi:predicted GNAT family N-acyltransferase
MNMEQLLAALATVCDVSDDIMKVANAKILTFLRGRARVTIRIAFEDEQSGADLVITNMTTLPDAERNLGNGSTCLSTLIHFAKRHGFENIQATQVQSQSEHFWQENGFVRLGNPTNDYAYTRT